VMMQWIPYGQTLDEFKDHVRTYASVFPHVIIAFGPGGNGLYMLGSNDPISFDQAAIQAVLSKPGVVEDLSSAADSPVHDLAGWAAEIPALRRQLHAIMAREIVRDHGVMMLLGSMRAEERLATFLLNLSKRFTARGFSPSEFHLRMTREELGSYLGLKLETVSRLFSRFHDDGLIEVQQKHVRILDSIGLQQVLATRH